MDDLQYNGQKQDIMIAYIDSFKPYYTWMTFNTIPYKTGEELLISSFKPYYTWMTFNTIDKSIIIK